MQRVEGITFYFQGGVVTMDWVKACLAFIAILATASFGLANTIHVPADSATIQAAIYGTFDGDTVLVANGTYFENIDFLGKAIIVKSEEGPKVTIIDGSQPSSPNEGSVVFFWNDEGSESVLDGFTLINGTGYSPTGWFTDGGGIYCSHASPTIKNNIITSNSVSGEGGGISITGASSPTISNNTISENQSDSYGGGIYIYCYEYDISPIITNNYIYGNMASSGAGICSLGSTTMISNNIIIGNSGLGFMNSYGAGIYADGDSLMIANNIISGNSSAWGGGLTIGWFPGEEQILVNNTIVGNSATYGGGGISFHPWTLKITNKKIASDSENLEGEWTYCQTGTQTLTNNTIANNTSSYGGGIYCDYTSSSVITNAIFSGDVASEGSEIWMSGTSTLTISYSDVQGGPASVYIEPGGSITVGPGNIYEDPLFADPSNDDYSLTASSPCIDAGDPSYNVPPGGGCRIDMGAYEYWKGFNCWKDKVPMQWRRASLLSKGFAK